MCLCAVCYRYLTRTSLDGKSCTWKAICNHNKDSGWPVETFTVAEFLPPISVYIKHVCAVPLFYIQIDVESSPGSLWSRLSTKGCWMWHGWEWLENTQDPTLRRDSDCHEPTVLIPTHIVSHLSPAPAGIKQPGSTPATSCPSKSPGEQEWWARPFWGCLCSTHMCVLSHHQPKLLPPPQGSAWTNPQ